MQQCPACAYELTPQEQVAGDGKCPSCDIYFAKYQARLEREAEQAKQAQAKQGKIAQVEKIKAEKAEKARAAKQTKALRMTPAQYYGGTLYCSHCGAVNNGKRHVPGSILIELVLWICFLIPGLIYSIWRHAAQKKVCASCNQPGLIPVMSPKAQRELKQ